MSSRLGIAFVSAFAVVALIASGCSKKTTATPGPNPSPTASVSPAPDTIYVQTSDRKQIRAFKNASRDNGATAASVVLPNNDVGNGDVVYDPVSDTLWYPMPQGQSTNNPIEVWYAASTKNGKNPDAMVPFTNGEGAAAFDPTHHLLFVATTTGPQLSVFANAETLTSSSTPAATITLAIVDNSSGATPRPQEMLYDAATDTLFASDDVSEVAVFFGFGAAAQAAVTGHTNPTISPDHYLQGLFSPDGLAYAQAADTLFIGEQISPGQVDVIAHASTVNGPVGHAQLITGLSHPGAMAFDGVRGLLFLYDESQVYVVPNALVASGHITGITGLHSIFDASGQLAGFGMALDTTH